MTVDAIERQTKDTCADQNKQNKGGEFGGAVERLFERRQTESLAGNCH